jgi:DNA-binding NarL/FixJ family response regulator
MAQDRMLHTSDDSSVVSSYDEAMDKGEARNAWEKDRTHRPLDVLVVDDQPRARKSLRALLATWGDVGTIREAAGGGEAIIEMEFQPPDLVVMDVLMPDVDGLTAARQIRERWPDTRIVLLSMDPGYADEALSAGADAFVSKGDSPQLLIERLAAVTRNR